MSLVDAMTRALPIVVAFVALAACSRKEPPPTKAGAAPGVPLALPDTLAAFAASPPEHGPTWIRRKYTRGGTHVDATLAISVQPPGGFEGWVASSAREPQAALAAPPGDVNGFYQCTDGPPPSCDLLVQMRSGVHLELRGGGTSTRADVDALAAGLPLAAWGAGRIDDPR
jgi:hypothetical protein